MKTTTTIIATVLIILFFVGMMVIMSKAEACSMILCPHFSRVMLTAG